MIQKNDLSPNTSDKTCLYYWVSLRPLKQCFLHIHHQMPHKIEHNSEKRPIPIIVQLGLCKYQKLPCIILRFDQSQGKTKTPVFACHLHQPELRFFRHPNIQYSLNPALVSHQMSSFHLWNVTFLHVSCYHRNQFIIKEEIATLQFLTLFQSVSVNKIYSANSKNFFF